MKTFKRNAVIVTVMLFVCVAVYLNWSYNNKDASHASITGENKTQEAADPSPSDASTADDAQTSLYYTEKERSSEEYFASARLSRQEARDAAAATLATVSETNGASQEMIDAAISEISELTAASLKESELESLIMSKGFSDCVVYIGDGGVSVTVPAPTEGLSMASVAQISDIIKSETDFTLENLKIIEVK